MFGGLALNSSVLEPSLGQTVIGALLVLASAVVLTLPMRVPFVSSHAATNAALMAFVASRAILGAFLIYGYFGPGPIVPSTVTAALAVKDLIAGLVFAALPLLAAAEDGRSARTVTVR